MAAISVEGAAARMQPRRHRVGLGLELVVIGVLAKVAADARTLRTTQLTPHPHPPQLCQLSLPRGPRCLPCLALALALLMVVVMVG